MDVPFVWKFPQNVCGRVESHYWESLHKLCLSSQKWLSHHWGFIHHNINVWECLQVVLGYVTQLYYCRIPSNDWEKICGTRDVVPAAFPCISGNCAILLRQWCSWFSEILQTCMFCGSKSLSYLLAFRIQELQNWKIIFSPTIWRDSHQFPLTSDLLFRPKHACFLKHPSFRGRMTWAKLLPSAYVKLTSLEH